MPGPTLVLLAAGLGSRFGGPKQLAPVGPAGEAIIDYTARDALAGGFGRLVLVVREEIAGAVEDHIRRRWPADAKPELVRQDTDPVAVSAVRAGRSKPLGTGHAVLAAAPVLDGPFGIANADDLYGPGALRLLAQHLRGGGGHALVGYHLTSTLLMPDRPVNRALCRVGAGGELLGIAEGEVRRDGGRLTWRPIGAAAAEGAAAPIAVTGDELVSTNLWGFTPEVVDVLAADFEAFVAGPGIAAGAEFLLPGVVGAHLGPDGLSVTVLPTEDRCVGLTHPDDLPLLQAVL